ncbi:MAG: adenosine deaminase [Lachnospiraceae bacterium]|jgi:adenosine deaminase|nr:adenosine deaminase [Lachnospiraceae bacterium]
MELEQLLSTPKYELHCHLDGSIPIKTFEDLLGRKVSKSEVTVASDNDSLDEYLQKFDLPLSIMQTTPELERVAHDVVAEVAKENVKYIEIRFAPQFSREKGLSYEEIMTAVIRGASIAKEETGVDFGFILCTMRQMSDEENLEMLKTCSRFLGKGVVAADAAGPEVGFPTSNFFSLFEEVKALGYPFTFHAGEQGDPQNILDAIEMGAKRIGHGIAMKGYPEIQKLCRDKGIGVEMCPISNIQTKAVKTVEDYPIKEFLGNGVLVSINTDNRTVSDTSLIKEFEFLQEKYGVTDEEILQMIENAKKTAFGR